LCEKCDDIITCSGSGHHLRPDRTEPGAPYFGKSLPLRSLSLPEFLRWCLLSRRLWFVVCFGKLSLSDIPIRNNQAASDRPSTVAKVFSKWRGRRKRTLATALAWSDAAWLFLMGISKRKSLPKQTMNQRRLESKHHRRNSGSDSRRTDKDFPKYGAPGSVLSGCKWWPLLAHVMMSSHFSHNELTPVQILLQYLHWCQNYYRNAGFGSKWDTLYVI